MWPVFVSIEPVCVSVGPFNPFIFQVIIDMHDTIIIYFIILGFFFFFMSIHSLLFPAWRTSFHICCQATLVVLNVFTFAYL